MNNSTTENPDEIVRRAAELKVQIAALEAEYDMIKTSVIERVKALASGMDKYALQVGEVGTFIISKYRKWEYSPELTEIENNLKARKKNEEATGVATATESDVLKFNIIKKDGQAD